MNADSKKRGHNSGRVSCAVGAEAQQHPENPEQLWNNSAGWLMPVQSFTWQFL